MPTIGGMKLEEVIKILLDTPAPSRGYKIHYFKKGKKL